MGSLATRERLGRALLQAKFIRAGYWSPLPAVPCQGDESVTACSGLPGSVSIRLELATLCVVPCGRITHGLPQDLYKLPSSANRSHARSPSCSLPTLPKQFSSSGWIGAFTGPCVQTDYVLCDLGALKGNANTKRHIGSSHPQFWQKYSSLVVQNCTTGRASKPCHYCHCEFERPRPCTSVLARSCFR